MRAIEILQALEQEGVELPVIIGNQYVEEISVSTKRKPGFVKCGITDEMAQSLLNREGMLFITVLPKDKTRAVTEAAKNSAR